MLEELSAQPNSAALQLTGRAPTVLVKANPLTAQLTEVGAYPVAKNMMVRLLATGPLTEDAVKTLIKHLQMGVDVGLYPSSDDEAQ